MEHPPRAWRGRRLWGSLVAAAAVLIVGFGWFMVGRQAVVPGDREVQTQGSGKRMVFVGLSRAVDLPPSRQQMSIEVGGGQGGFEVESSVPGEVVCYVAVRAKSGRAGRLFEYEGFDVFF